MLKGPPFGESALWDPVLELRQRQVCWMQLLYNSPGMVGDVHRFVAWDGDTWCEPSAAVRSAMKSLGWSVQRNKECARARGWPRLQPELGYLGQISVTPVDDFPQPGAMFTDGSLGRAGGAAAVREFEEEVVTARVTSPRSSTHCELVALALAMQLCPPEIHSDSLAALTMLGRWRAWPTRKVIECRDRMEVRLVLALAAEMGKEHNCAR